MLVSKAEKIIKVDCSAFSLYYRVDKYKNKKITIQLGERGENYAEVKQTQTHTHTL